MTTPGGFYLKKGTMTDELPATENARQHAAAV